MNIRKVAVAFTWLPGSGKSWLGEWLNIPGYYFHDMDNHWLENSIVW
jgi:dephospho-CoA kinase